MTLQVLTELKAVFKSDDGLELNGSKTSILPKGTTTQAMFDMGQTIIQATPSLTHLTNVDFAEAPGFNILIRILCLVIVVFYNNSM